ncbi:MAG: NHL repeat-containing protein [Longimicrobiales bacterium]
MGGKAGAGTLGEMGHALALGEILTDQTVGVLGGTAFPGVMGGGEEEASAGGLFGVTIAVELGAIVDGHGVDGSAGLVDERNGAATGPGSVAGRELADHGTPIGGITMRANQIACLAATLLLAACGGGSEGERGEWTTSVETVNGVMHVVNTPPEGGGGPTHVVEEEFRVGVIEGGGPYSFGLIRSVAVLSDGRIAVADGQAEEVRLFTAGGEHQRTFGGEGQGPGELKGMLGVYAHDGMLRVAEQSNARLSVFHPDTGFVTSYPLVLYSYGFRGPWAAVTDSLGRTYVESSGQYGEGRFWNMVRVYDAAMNQLDSMPYHDYTDQSRQDEVPGAWKVQLGSNAWTWAEVPYYARPYQILTPTGGFWSTTQGKSQLEVSLWAPPGDTSLVLTSLRRPDRVSPAERDSAMEALEQRFAERTGSRPGLDPSRVPSDRPTAYGLFLDDRSRLWVRLSELSADTTDYDVFRSDGHHTATVRIPFRVDGWVPPVVRGDTIWAVATDETDVQYVVRARVRSIG